MSIRFISSPFSWPVALVLSLSTSLASAQAAAPPTAPTTPAATPPVFRSVLEGYQPYTDEKAIPWKEANDRVGRIGGWREYAKEAQQADMQDAAAKPDPHAGHAKP